MLVGNEALNFIQSGFENSIFRGGSTGPMKEASPAVRGIHDLDIFMSNAWSASGKAKILSSQFLGSESRCAALRARSSVFTSAQAPQASSTAQQESTARTPTRCLDREVASLAPSLPVRSQSHLGSWSRSAHIWLFGRARSTLFHSPESGIFSISSWHRVVRLTRQSSPRGASDSTAWLVIRPTAPRAARLQRRRASRKPRRKTPRTPRG